jgi:hypothetical protein
MRFQKKSIFRKKIDSAPIIFANAKKRINAFNKFVS